MMKRWWHYLLLGLFAWLCFMLWRFPATVAYDMGAGSLGGQVQLAGLSGTLWQGEAEQLQYQEKVVASPGWSLSPWSLLLGRVEGVITLHVAEGYLQTQAQLPLGGGEMSFSDIKGQLPLSLIQPYLPMVPLPLEGELSLKLDKLLLSVEGRPLEAEGRVVWHQAGVQVMDKLAFGDLQMSLHSAEGGGIEGTLSDSGGPLELGATFTLSTEGTYQLEGQVKARESAAKALRDSLVMLGKSDSQGHYPLRFSGAL